MKECIYYLLTQKKAAHKTKHMYRPVFSCCIHIPSHSVQFCHSCHQSLLLEPLFPSTLPSLFYNLASNYWYRNDVKMILPLFHWAKHIGWHGGNSSTRLVGGTSATQTPCELYSILRINPYNWTFSNCNITFIMDQSTNKTTNEWLLQVAYEKTCSTLGALLFAWQQQQQQKQKQQKSVGYTKSKDRHTVVRSCLFWSSVFGTICPLKNLPNFRHFDDVVLNLRIHS